MNIQDKDTTIRDEYPYDDALESTDTNIRYAGYAARVRTVLAAAHRYVAYTSDIGESFRPVAHPYLVSCAYGVSWLYLLGDVGYEAWKAKLIQEGRYRSGLMPWQRPPPPAPAEEITELPKNYLDWKTVAFKRAIFQSVASMGLPAFTIHSTVRYAGKAMKNVKNPKLRTYGPVSLGLAIVPALPFMFDEPVEKTVDYAFEKFAEVSNTGL